MLVVWTSLISRAVQIAPKERFSQEVGVEELNLNLQCVNSMLMILSGTMTKSMKISWLAYILSTHKISWAHISLTNISKLSWARETEWSPWHPKRKCRTLASDTHRFHQARGNACSAKRKHMSRQCFWSKSSMMLLTCLSLKPYFKILALIQALAASNHCLN